MFSLLWSVYMSGVVLNRLACQVQKFNKVAVPGLQRTAQYAVVRTQVAPAWFELVFAAVHFCSLVGGECATKQQ
jgi:hypothetical protein